MIELTDDKMRNRLRKSLDTAAESPSTAYAEKHTHLVNLYLNYLLTNYPPKEKSEGREKN